jgi:hypothetical protein
MKKTLITIVLSTFLLSMPVSSEGREVNPSGDEIQAISTPVSSSAQAFLQTIGIGRRRTVHRRRMVRRRVRRHRRVMVRRTIRRRRGRRVGIHLPIPRGVGVGVRRRRGY